MNIQKFNRFQEVIHLSNRSISIQKNPALSRSPVSKAFASSGFSIMRIYSKSKPGQRWKQDAVLLPGPPGLTGKMSQTDRPDPSHPRKVPGIPVSLGWNGNHLKILRQSTRGRITPPPSAIIPDLSRDIQVCSA